MNKRTDRTFWLGVSLALLCPSLSRAEAGPAFQGEISGFCSGLQVRCWGKGKASLAGPEAGSKGRSSKLADFRSVGALSEFGGPKQFAGALAGDGVPEMSSGIPIAYAEGEFTGGDRPAHSSVADPNGRVYIAYAG